jgi:small subunit ribosomal protein S1
MSWTKRVGKPGEIVKIGQEVEAVVIEISRESQKIALSLKQAEENPWEMVYRNYPVGAHIRGRVRNMTAYGAFIELEAGIDGMVHVSDMSWTRNINNPNEFLKKGDEVDAIVLSIDNEQQRIALGIKQLINDPWPDIQKRYKVGAVVTGTVTRIVPYGAFIKLEDDLEGLVHISQISETRIDKVKSVLAVGQEVSARVIKVDNDDRRIGLSIKAAQYDDVAFAEEMKEFEKIKGTDELNSLSDMFYGIDESLSAKDSEADVFETKQPSHRR